MIDPIIFTIHLGSLTLSLHWYGVFVMLGVVVGGYVSSLEVEKHGENPDLLWDALMWILPAGVIGARLWYVVNATLGGNLYYVQNPIQILNIPQGGLHFYGGLLFGLFALVVYLRKQNADLWLFLDSIAPALLLGQALARPANFINQELYGQPTTLPWGIPIDAAHRLTIFKDLVKYPVETTRFHPTFGYEMIWNLLCFALIYYLVRRTNLGKTPGASIALWMMAAGFGRTWIEFFRPDQPLVAGSWLTTSMLVSFVLGAFGVVLFMGALGKISLIKEKLPADYSIKPKSSPEA